MQTMNARALPQSMPLSTNDAELYRNTLEIARSVMPTDLRSPILDMFSKSSIRSPEIMLNPATMVMRTRMKKTLKSITSNQSKMTRKRDAEDTAMTEASSSSL